MKRLIALCVALVFAMGTAGLAVAQEKKAEEKKSDMKMEKKAEKKPAVKTASGTVKSASADSLVVAGKPRQGRGVDVRVSTPRRRSRRVASPHPARLKQGDSPGEVHEDAGKAMAQSVVAKAPPRPRRKLTRR